MEFQVPQFIGREATIIGTLTFRQFLTLTVAGFAILMLFFFIPKQYFFVFLLLALIIAAVGIVFAFIQTGGQTFPVLMKNLVFYFLKPRVYVWHKKGMPAKLERKAPQRLEISQRPERHRIELTKTSQVKKLQTQIETKERW